MAPTEQEHLRIRLHSNLLKLIDEARAKSGRTRTDEIEARLLESFHRLDMTEMARIAAREALRMVEERVRDSADPANKPMTSFYDALYLGKGVKGVKGPKK